MVHEISADATDFYTNFVSNLTGLALLTPFINKRSIGRKHQHKEQIGHV